MWSVAQSEHRVVRLDGRQMRTLAHPLRMRLLGALRLDGPATATALAARLGTNSGKTSYHLRQLAEAGLVEEDTDRGNARDRWWRAAHGGTSWNAVDFLDDPDASVAADWMTGHVARVHARWTSEFIEARAAWSREWQNATNLSDYHLTLTPQRLEQLGHELDELVERYRDDEVTPGTEPVTVIIHSFPHPEPTL